MAKMEVVATNTGNNVRATQPSKRIMNVGRSLAPVTANIDRRFANLYVGDAFV